MTFAGVEAQTIGLWCRLVRLQFYYILSSSLILILLPPTRGTTNIPANRSLDPNTEDALTLIDNVASGNLGALCSMDKFLFLPMPVLGVAELHDATREKVDMASTVLKDMGVTRDTHERILLGAIAKSLLASERQHVLAARVLLLNATSETLLEVAAWKQVDIITTGSPQINLEGLNVGSRPDRKALPWLPEKHFLLLPPRFLVTDLDELLGRWTVPYYSCSERKWIISYTVVINAEKSLQDSGLLSIISLDVNLSDLDVNQCSMHSNELSPLTPFLNTHKCHEDSSTCEMIPDSGWIRGAYRCNCKPAFYARPPFFIGKLVEQAWLERETNRSNLYDTKFRCLRCAPGCANCTGPEPCLADYNWPFRITLLTVTCICVLFSLILIGYVVKHHKLKVFKVASPTFLSITLLGCAIMYLEMAAIFPVLDIYSCVATKWTRHLGFCITYTALLMKTWRVSLTYRVKSAHKVKLTDKQLLQWMFPILLVMLIYLGTWTLSAPPMAEDIRDRAGLRFKQCTYNWWDHSLAIGEVLFLAWGIRVCYNVRHAESLYNEARLISYAIYNIAAVNIAMVAFHLFIFPRAGPDIKYLLGFIRTQLSTSVTMALVFGPKVYRVLRGQGDQYDSRARARGVTASFSLNGIGLVPEEPPDLYQENEELKEEVQKLAAQIEFMRIVHMEMNNRHLKPKPGGYFSNTSAGGGGKSHSSRSEPSDVSLGMPSDIMNPAGAVASTSGLGDRL